MFYHANVRLANDIKSTETRWTSTTPPVELTSPDPISPTNDVIMKTERGDDITVAHSGIFLDYF